MHSDGWRMRANKGGRKGEATNGFADLKRLRKAAASSASTEPQPATPLPTTAKAAQTAKLAEPALSREDALLFRRAMKRSEEHTSELQSLMRISVAVLCLNKQKRNQQ